MQQIEVTDSSSISEEHINDFLLRVKTEKIGADEGKDYDIDIVAIQSTAVMHSHLEELLFIFGNIIGNQWHTQKYAQEYVSFLTGLIAEDEFERIRQQYEIEYQDWDNDRIRFASEIIFESINEQLTSADISSLINVHPHKIEDALNSNSSSKPFLG